MTNQSIRIEQVVLDDGRRAERHTAVEDNGDEIIEVFAEEKRPLKLEKRVRREMKQVVAKEIHEQVRDGVVTYQEVHSLEPEIPLQIRERIGVADHAKIVDGDYIRKEEIGPMIADGVVAGLAAVMDKMQPVMVNQASSNLRADAPVFTAQSIVEQNVEEKKNKDWITNVTMGVLVVLQAGFLIYMIL